MRRRLICGPLDARAQGRRHGLRGHGQKNKLRQEPGHRFLEPVLRPRRLRRRGIVPFDGLDLPARAGHRQAHVEHGPPRVGPLLRARVVPVDGNLVPAVRDPTGPDGRRAGQVRLSL